MDKEEDGATLEEMEAIETEVLGHTIQPQPSPEIEEMAIRLVAKYFEVSLSKARESWNSEVNESEKLPYLTEAQELATIARRGWMKLETTDITCPFCGDDDYDLEGLKGHLVNDCEVFQITISSLRLFGGG